MSMDNIRECRNMPFLKRGMKVLVAGRKGVVTSSNQSLNINVRFENRRKSINCHPQWETVYYDDKDNIVADYRENKR